MEYTVHSLASQLDLWPQVTETVSQVLTRQKAKQLLVEIAALPVRKSRSARNMGSYVSRQGEPFCIRLHFSLEPAVLKETFLHELAHACDHLSNQKGRAYRKAHGPGWKQWAAALGIEGTVRGKSEVLSQLYKERLKPVAVCRRCGTEFLRVRRLNRNRIYTHQACGGRLEPL